MTPRRQDRAVLFDLFGTLVSFDASRLPTLEVPHGVVRSTVPAYASLLAEIAPAVDPVAFYEALAVVSGEITRQRKESQRELPSRERFARALRYLAVGGENVDAYAERLSVAHMEQLVAATVAPASHRALLERLGKKRALGCISNFDHAPSAIRILERAGLAPFLEVIVVSDAFGFCKPAPAIFQEALRRLDVSASESTFVGDSFDDDVRGARAAGLRAVWLNPTGAVLPPGLAPDAVIRQLSEIEALVSD